ncbi:alpha/beta hydrolase [Rhizohabitans arisaemae]|uniref:alpha/beta hydrolase n=1 Tax=Rhizohabitans arisaemae TaxID=2720610 RepID=UPI0024B26089|nr:alpha/beta hydrolase [Rhizohabitans arisaemae]
MSEPDILGPEYESTILPLGHDAEGEVVATLVRRRAANHGGQAVLYLHGFTDYFFQRHLADFFVDAGFDFYALDLRKYGRSLRPHQTPGLVSSVTEYFTEIDEAVRIIREADGHGRLLINAHSTGGLIASLWADRVRGRGLIDAMVLNSPFLDLNVPAPIRHTTSALTGVLARLPLRARLPLEYSRVYGGSLHRDHHGEWDYNLAWKPMGGFPVHATWLAAIRRAQLRLQAGLAIDVPILVLAARKAMRLHRFTVQAHQADLVLNPEHMARWAPALGDHVTCVRFDDGIHDLILSPEPVRSRVFAEMDRWLSAYLAGWKVAVNESKSRRSSAHRECLVRQNMA